ncbi:hypothetical protein [Pedobacter frigiditerrae]|uniref:hypothetical protein n=1 Tax=Pedobacter frigiditerrae TaxID=2530452 RepID=UPI00292F901F|nr:hypothetical protein [Pedobacter frigiditerrae]
MNQIKLKKFIFLCFILITSSCYHDEHDTSKKALNKTKIVRDNFKKVRDSSTRIVIKLYNIDEHSNMMEDTSKAIWSNSIVNFNELKQFDHLFNSIKNGGYSCCPRTHYKLSFYQGKYKIMTYNVDTISRKNKALFFDNDFQTSYLISLEEWNKFLNKKQ